MLKEWGGMLQPLHIYHLDGNVEIIER